MCMHVSCPDTHSAAWGLAAVMAAPLLAAFHEDATRCLAFAAMCMGIAGLMAFTLFSEMPPESRCSDLFERIYPTC